jgi:hypothetical protein
MDQRRRNARFPERSPMMEMDRTEKAIGWLMALGVTLATLTSVAFCIVLMWAIVQVVQAAVEHL